MWSLSGLSLAAGWLDSLVASWLGERLDVDFAILLRYHQIMFFVLTFTCNSIKNTLVPQLCFFVCHGGVLCVRRTVLCVQGKSLFVP